MVQDKGSACRCHSCSCMHMQQGWEGGLTRVHMKLISKSLLANHLDTADALRLRVASQCRGMRIPDLRFEPAWAPMLCMAWVPSCHVAPRAAWTSPTAIAHATRWQFSAYMYVSDAARCVWALAALINRRLEIC